MNLRGCTQKIDMGLDFDHLAGRTDNATLDRLVSQEAEMHNDMIVFPFLDTYRNLTLKFVHAIRWIKAECYLPGIESVVKVDDDVWVNMPMLQRYELQAKQVDTFRSTSDR